MRECVVEVQFSHSGSKFWNLRKNSSVISAWKVREKLVISPWKCVKNLWFWSHQKNFKIILFSIVNLFSSRWFIAYTISDQGDHGRARVSLESARKGIQGQSWSQWFWWVRAEGHIWCIGLILLDSPLYQFKGSCFREVCADEGAVGGNPRGSTGVYIRDYTCVYSQFISILSFFRVKWKGYFQWIMYFLDRASLTGHFGSSGIQQYIADVSSILLGRCRACCDCRQTGFDQTFVAAVCCRSGNTSPAKSMARVPWKSL